MPISPFTMVLAGDSRVLGLGDPASYDFVVPPVVGNLGSGFTSLPALNLSGSTDGTGAVLSPQLIRNAAGAQINSGLVIGVSSRGKGYNNPALAPTFLVTGGGGSGETYTWTLGGGYVVPLEAALRANGLLATLTCAAVSGTNIATLDFAASAGASAIRSSLASQPNTILVINTGINDVAIGISASTWATSLNTVIANFLPLVAAIIVEKPYGAPNANANAAALNAGVQSYWPAVDAAVAANPGRVFAGSSAFNLMAAHPEYYGNSGNAGVGIDIHPNAAGNAALSAAMAAAYTPILTSLFGANPTTPPPPPQSLSLTMPLTLTWPAVFTATGYRVYKNGLLMQDSPALTFSDTFLLGRSHVYVVTAYNPIGESTMQQITVSDNGLIQTKAT